MRGVFILIGILWLITVAALIAYAPELARLFHSSSLSPIPPSDDTLPPLPEKFFPTARMEFTSLPGGISSMLDLKTTQGGLASVERALDGSYQAITSFRATVPRPATSLSDLQTACPDLSQLWPRLEALLPGATASPFYHSLYERKLTFIESRLKHFRHYPSRHNFFDCQTILELIDPDSRQPLLLVQADMDVVTDGSDGDRVTDASEIDDSSIHYQPFTAYNWAKTTAQPNPLLPHYQARLDEVLKKIKDSTGSETDKMPLYEERNRLQKIIEAMKFRSSLVAHLDPFIVLPGYMFRTSTPHTPRMGDYVIVLFEGKAYPAIIGDSGPYSKIGEASLLLAKTLNPDSSGTRRAVSHLTVTYLIFPDSREPKMQAPDLEKWHQRCTELMQSVGGLSVPLHRWR